MHLATLLSADNVRLYSCALEGPRQNASDPPLLGRRSLVFSGQLRISAPEGRELAYLKIGSLSMPLLLRTRIWRLHDTLIFSQPAPGRFWSLEIPFGRIDVILSQVCNLQPRVNVSEPVEEETGYNRPSAAVRDAMEMCRPRPTSAPFLEEDQGPYRAPPHQTRQVLIEEFDFSPQSMRFDDPPEELDVSSMTANTTKYSFLDSDTEDEEELRAHTPLESTPPRLEQPYTPSRSSSLGAFSSPKQHSPFTLSEESATFYCALQPSPLGRARACRSHSHSRSPSRSPSHTPPLTPPRSSSLNASRNGSPRPPVPPLPILHTPSEESFGPESPGVFAKNPVFIATPTHSFTNLEVTDELFAPDHPFMAELDAADSKHIFEHPLVPRSIYCRDPTRPALRSKDLVRIGANAHGRAASQQEVGSVGAYISWQMINRICGTAIDPA